MATDAMHAHARHHAACKAAPGRGARIRALTHIDVVVVLIIVGVTAAVLIFSLARKRELMRRQVCMRNIGDIGHALWAYADENMDYWPVAPHAPAEDNRIGNVDYTQAIGSYRGQADNPDAGNTGLMSPLPTKLSTTRNLWLLFRLGHIARSKFVCPSTVDEPNAEPKARDYWDFGTGDIAGPATPEQSRLGYRQISYGYQVPYGKKGKPCFDWDKNPYIADKGPYGAAIEIASPPPPPMPTSRLSWQECRPWNSPNHGGEGQVGSYPAAGVEFFSYPLVGWGGDNIYTQQLGDPDPSKHWLDHGRGKQPTLGGRETPLGDTDSLIYP